jgi:hypothetical protein
MFNHSGVRRSVSVLVFVASAMYFMHYLDYNPDMRSQLWSIQSFLVLLMVLVAVVVLIAAIMKPRPVTVVLAFVLGLLMATYGNHLLYGNILFYVVLLVVTITLFVLSIYTELAFVSSTRFNRFAIRRPVKNS